jgi:three-Cys-motif partner protein
VKKGNPDMPRLDLHKKPYDEGTKEKLDFYHDYLLEWLYVFINSPYVNALQIFDFFAGPGSDKAGKPGSPVIICDEIHKVLEQREIKHKIRLYFNELDAEKFKDLSIFLKKQKKLMPQVELFEKQFTFHDAFDQWSPYMKAGATNLLFLDQNGLDQITKPIFQRIVAMPKTDFIFFIASAMVNRFKEKYDIRKYVPITDDDLKTMNNNNVHRLLTNAYQHWIPNGTQYFLGSYSIKKGANVYGLVFGSGHPRGIDKFLQIAWKHGGDANFDIDGDSIDPKQPSLFKEDDIPTKIKVFEKELEKEIFGRRLKTNKDIYIFTLQNGMLSVHARNTLNELINNKKLPKQKFHISYDAWDKHAAESIQHFTGASK